eukprot:1372641-Ditylum_brightwellii.AAC.1
MEITNLCIYSQQSIQSTNIIQAINDLREDNKAAFKYLCQEQDDFFNDLYEQQNTIRVSLIEYIKDVSGEIEQKMAKILANTGVRVNRAIQNIYNMVSAHLSAIGTTPTPMSGPTTTPHYPPAPAPGHTPMPIPTPAPALTSRKLFMP